MALKTAKTTRKQFRVVSGMHRQNGKNYKKGDLIKSETDLVKVFGKKFERVKESVPVADSSPPAKKKKPKRSAG